MVLELLVVIFMVLLFRWVARQVRADAPPKNTVAGMFEALLEFIRRDIAYKNIGHDAGKFVPLLWGVFFFILFCNLMGLIPWLGTPTGAIGCTIALAAGILVTTLYTGFSTFGPKWVWKGFVPHMDLPAWLFPLKVVIAVAMLAIEWLGLMIKHTILAVRLLANMAAGHLVLLGIMGMIVAAAQNPEANYAVTAGAGLFGATAISVLELGVCFIQAYVFTLLAALFIGSAAHEH
jgi:F-type H+-transporting ATPase subunit a